VTDAAFRMFGRDAGRGGVHFAIVEEQKQRVMPSYLPVFFLASKIPSRLPT
jgi:hypothetical protein